MKWALFIRIRVWRGFLDGPQLNNKACLWQITCVIALMHFLKVPTLEFHAVICKNFITYNMHSWFVLQICKSEIYVCLVFKRGFPAWHVHGSSLV